VVRVEPANLAPAEVSDAVLVNDILAGDPDALAALMQRYYVTLVQFVTRYVGAADVAEDVVQDVFVQVWASRERWAVRTTCRAYLYGAARNGALKALRSARRRQRAEVTAADLSVVSVPDGMAGVREGELRDAFADAVQALPARCREIFVLTHDQGLSYDETARALGVSASTVRNQIARALAALERALAPFFVVVLVGFLRV
jgi:RNA polymerase sigma-70 factor (ECF subfamily)